MIKRLVIFVGLATLLSLQCLFAQRPIPMQQNTGGFGQTTRPAREVVEQEDQEDTDGRRPLLDDSTRQVYGPKTTLYFFEKTSNAIDFNSMSRIPFSAIFTIMIR
ncbi:hypothetical protein [Algoriphagus boritolerans]|uniref:hypothetical protein n=1 Tax=Algoriphagus boritolerans TaxID=308111 RepID=UPI000B1EF9AC